MADNEAAYFYESLQQNAGSNLRIDTDPTKNSLTEKRKTYRNDSYKNEMLALLQSCNSLEIYNNIDTECKKAKQANEQSKDQLKQRKVEQRKHRKNVEKVIAEIFQIRQEINKKQMHLQRLNSECGALQSKQEKYLNDIQSSNKYHIQQLLTEESCKQIISEQTQTLQSLSNQTNNYKALKLEHDEKSIEQTRKCDELKKKCQTYQDLLSTKQSQQHRQTHQAQSDASNAELVQFQQSLESMKRLLSIKKVAIHSNSNELYLEFESPANEIYLIQIKLEAVTPGGDERGEQTSYGIQYVQVTNNDTKYTEITDYVLEKYRKDMHEESESNAVLPMPLMTVKNVVMEILLILRKLPARFADISKLYELYNGKQDMDMIPWFPESDQLVFKFKFRQKISVEQAEQNQHENANERDEEDEKMKELAGTETANESKKKEKMVIVDVPLVIAVSWEYPQAEFVNSSQVITIRGSNCNVNGKDHQMLNTKAIEEKWKTVLEETVNAASGQFQNDIVRFVNFIHDRLQRFAESDQ